MLTSGFLKKRLGISTGFSDTIRRWLPTRPGQCRIRTWKQFAQQVRSKGCKLLLRLDDFPNSVLVAGCQRSGTTMLARLITSSEGMVNYWFGLDDELDAALILSGYVDHSPRGRYCFQTTYLNECVSEYYDHNGGHKIIWVLRNPFSVVYSMLHNWKRFALNELFDACGVHLLNDQEYHLYRRFGVRGVSRLKRACLSYNGKVSQVFELAKGLNQGSLMVLEYDDLVNRKNELLPLIYQFIDLPYKPNYVDGIHSKSLKSSSRLATWERMLITKVCVPVYEQARGLTGL